VTKEEIKDIVDAVAQSNMQANMELAGYVDKMIDKTIEMTKSGQLLPGLAFKVEYTEVRQMLRAKAKRLREEAEQAEKNLPGLLEQAKLEAAKQFGAARMPAPVSAALVEAELEILMQQTRAKLLEDITRGREEADRFDWQAAHLDERAYTLTTHDLELILSTPTASAPSYLPPYLRAGTRR